MNPNPITSFCKDSHRGLSFFSKVTSEQAFTRVFSDVLLKAWQEEDSFWETTGLLGVMANLARWWLELFARIAKSKLEEEKAKEKYRVSLSLQVNNCVMNPNDIRYIQGTIRRNFQHPDGGSVVATAHARSRSTLSVHLKKSDSCLRPRWERRHVGQQALIRIPERWLVTCSSGMDR